MGYSFVPAPYVEKTILSPLNCLGNPVENQLTLDVWVYFWILGSNPFICMSFSVPDKVYF